jgi:hypothetical protein
MAISVLDRTFRVLYAGWRRGGGVNAAESPHPYVPGFGADSLARELVAELLEQVLT